MICNPYHKINLICTCLRNENYDLCIEHGYVLRGNASFLPLYIKLIKTFSEAIFKSFWDVWQVGNVGGEEKHEASNK